MPRITDLIVYPVKALGGIHLSRASINPTGIQYDRQWMLVDERGQFVSQRQHPRLALFTTEFDDDHLLIRKDSEHWRIPLQIEWKEDQKAEVWGQEIITTTVSSSINEWFSDHIHQKVRLVAHGNRSKRLREKPHGTFPLMFADGYPLLIATEESLEALNHALEHPIPMNRFRPNIVLRGTTPWEEFQWKSLRAGKELIEMAKACERCTVTGVDQHTGVKTAKEPLKTLVQLHGSPALFGMNAIPSSRMELRLGDSLEIG